LEKDRSYGIKKNQVKPHACEVELHRKSRFTPRVTQAGIIKATLQAQKNLVLRRARSTSARDTGAQRKSKKNGERHFEVIPGKKL